MIQQGEWTAPDEMAAEVEVAEFICGLIRLMKPNLVIETGCYHGHTSHAIRVALRKNKKGVLHTCDSDLHNARMGDAQFRPGEDMIFLLPDNSVDIAFLDSGGEFARAREAKELIPKLSPIAFVLLHDSLNKEDKCHTEISAVCNWPSVVLPYGRGLTMFCIGQDIAQARIPR